MNFLDLENAHKSYSLKWNTELFNEYKSSKCWNFVDLNQESVEKDILGFLNKWGICRIPNESKIELFQALLNLKENIQYFKDKKLWLYIYYNNKTAYLSSYIPLEKVYEKDYTPQTAKITTKKKIILDFHLNSIKLLKDNKVKYDIYNICSYREED